MARPMKALALIQLFVPLVAILWLAVGNSGNTDEPHLHIHAQRPGPASAPLSGDPLFIAFEGGFLALNMTVNAEE